MTLELHATPAEVMRAVDALREFGQARRIPENTLFGLALALEESGSNIVNHALRGDARQTFRVTFEHLGGAMVIELRDRGPEFDPTRARLCEPSSSDEDRPPGGWGLELVRHYTDEARYSRESGENVLRLTKGLGRILSPEMILPEQLITKTKPIMTLEIRIQKNVGDQHTGAVTVKLGGSLDTATAPDLERQLTPVLAGAVKDLVFDLADLKFISSAGLRVFTKARKALKERGGQAAFVNLQPQIQEVFEIIKSLPSVAVFKTVAELDSYLAARQRTHEENR